MALTEIWGNNSSSILAVALAPGDTTLTVAPGTGVLFPNPIPGYEYFRMVITPSITPLSTIEIVFVTQVSGDTFTIQRAQEGTSAGTWLAGDNCYNTITAGSADTFIQLGTAAAITINDFASSKTANGYQNLPGGLLLQWGENTMTGSPGSLSTFNFPVVFPNQCLQITGSPVSALQSFSLGFDPVTPATYRVGINSSNGSTAVGINFRYIAIGW